MSDCWCDYDPPEFYARETRRARKQHKCYECCGRILPGETYEHVVGKYDGYLSEFKTCSRCADLRQWLTNCLPCFCWAHGNIHDDAREAVDAAYTRARDEVRGLAFGLGRRLVAIQRHNRLAA